MSDCRDASRNGYRTVRDGLEEIDVDPGSRRGGLNYGFGHTIGAACAPVASATAGLRYNESPNHVPEAS